MPRPTTTRAALRYAWTLAGTLAAVGACYALEAATGQTILYPVSAAVGSAAYLLGGGPALVAAVAGGLGTLPIALSGRSGDLARWVVLMVADAVLVALGARFMTARTRERDLAAALEAERARFTVAQEVSPHGFSLLAPVRDARGRLVDLRFTYANPAAGRLLGADPGALVGAALTEVLPSAMQRMPHYAQVLRTGQPFTIEVGQTIGGRTGVYELTCVRVERDLAVSFRDVTARHRVEERDRLLADVAVVMDVAPEVAPRLEALAHLLVDRVADAVRIDVADDTGVLRLGAVSARDRAHEALLRQLPEPGSADPLGRLVRAGHVERLDRLDEAGLDRLVGAGRAREVMRELGGTSAIVLPLFARGRAVGAVLAVRTGDRSPLDDGDEALLRLLAGRAALAIDNARLFEQQRGIARTLQQSLLPDALPLVPGLELAARYRAAGEGLEVGGDFYDVLARGTDGASWTAVVGDVVGKGAEAAAVTSLVRHTLRLAAAGASPASALRHVNDAVRGEHRPGLFCTAAAVALTVCDDGSVALCSASAGHPAPLVVRADGRVEELAGEGMLLGWMEDVRLDESPGRLAPGDAIVLYTDGVVEARGNGDFFGERRLHDVLRACRGQDAARIAVAVEDAAVAHARRRPRDDIAVLVASAPSS